MAIASLWLAACATTKPTPPAPGGVVPLRGLASWYGDEFAGRPTANGEIFNPKQLTAAHRTFPFGTVVDVTYVSTGRSTRVRVNDRGPFVGNRIIDLSYAAASEIGMVDDGIGEVEIAVVSVGGGEREPPKPYNVTIPDAGPSTSATAVDASVATRVPPPAPTPLPEPAAVVPAEPSVVTEELAASAPPPTAAPSRVDAPRPAPPAEAPAKQAREGFAVQLGAFSVEANALEMKAKVERFARPVSIERLGGLYRVRVGPWASRSRAIEEKERLEAAGYASIVVRVN